MSGAARSADGFIIHQKNLGVNGRIRRQKVSKNAKKACKIQAFCLSIKSVLNLGFSILHKNAFR